jgi:hypothetical protein
VVERAALLIDEFNEGTLDLKHILSEDEDARLLVATEETMFPDLDNMFELPKGSD